MVDFVILPLFVFLYRAGLALTHRERVSPVLLRILCVSWLFLVLQRITLGFDSMGDRLYSVWTPFLQRFVFVCVHLERCFLYGSIVFFQYFFPFPFSICVFQCLGSGDSA